MASTQGTGLYFIFAGRRPHALSHKVVRFCLCYFFVFTPVYTPFPSLYIFPFSTLWCDCGGLWSGCRHTAASSLIEAQCDHRGVGPAPGAIQLTQLI